MRVLIARVAAAIVAVLVTFLAGKFGVEVSEDARATLTEGVTLIGLGVWGISYGVLHKLMNRKLNPADTAKSNPAPPPRRIEY